MKVEQNFQEGFINKITSPDELNAEDKELQVYQDLVYYRFLEVFEKAYPRFKKMISGEKFSELIYKFLKVGAKDPILWRVSGEFKIFLINENNLEMDFLADLLEFEFLEVQMYMHKYQEHKKEAFSLESSYLFCEDTHIRHFSFAVHNPEFDENIEKFEKGKYIVLFYYDAETASILYEEITPFVAKFLQILTTKNSLHLLIKKTAKLYEISTEELMEILLPILKNYKSKNIILSS